MTHNKPVLSVIVRDKGSYSEEDLCTAVATAVMWFIDEIIVGYSHTKYEEIFKLWQKTGSLVDVRSANEEQWWQFLTAPGMTEQYGNVQFHVIPPMPKSEIPMYVIECPKSFKNIAKDSEVEAKEFEMVFPTLSINLMRQEKFTISEYIDQAISAAIINYIGSELDDYSEPWSNSNYALNVSIVDNLEFLKAPRIVMQVRGSDVPNIQALWVEDPEHTMR